jgi:hypothetical protein
MATGIQFVRHGRVRQWLSGDGPASRGAFAFMFVAALLCGATLAGLLFVGVWRHTAGEAASNRDAQLGAQQALRASTHTVANLRVRLVHEQGVLAKANRAASDTNAALAAARRALARARTALTRTEAADSAARSSLAARASALSGTAGTLARATATLGSELTALETYALHPGPTGVDPGYLATQVRYLETSAAAASSAAGDLAQRADELQASSSGG